MSLRFSISLLVLGLAASAPALAQSSDLPVSVRDSFSLGSGGSALCQVQSRAQDAARLFRQSVRLNRSIGRARMQYAALTRFEDAASRTAEIDGPQVQLRDLEAQEQAIIFDHVTPPPTDCPVKPAPDDFDATARLITGLFSAGAGVATGDALLAAEQALMRDPLTAHPYYWAGFAVIGDAARPLVRVDGMAAATVFTPPFDGGVQAAGSR